MVHGLELNLEIERRSHSISVSTPRYSFMKIIYLRQGRSVVNGYCDPQDEK